ncbi:MAG: hypothetical protein K2R98_26390 [Gemmataceae bacterium]|nr:hypothetical protein [Gemmataceae bacterium]
MDLDVFDLIVLSITMLMAGFILIWWRCPSLRPWMEAPKYRILAWAPGATRDLDSKTDRTRSKPE